MNAKTKFQKQIVALSNRLPGLSDTQKSWAYDRCLPHRGTCLKNGTASCLDCGHQWKISINPKQEKFSTTCPKCSSQIKVEITRRKVYNESAYFCIISCFQKHQVIRYFQVTGAYKAGKPAGRNILQISQIWLNASGKFGVVGRVMVYSPYGGEIWGGTMELRHNGIIDKHNFYPDYIYPRKSVIPELQRNGFKGNLHRFAPFGLFKLLLNNPQAETLIKSGQMSLFTTDNWSKIDKHWNAVKICIRNNYIIPKGADWLDYLDLLTFFGKDTRNPKYVCPRDLHKEHNRYVSKKLAYLKAKKLEEMKQKIETDQKQYVIDKKNFIGLSFAKDNLTVSVINSVREVMEIGMDHRHCVFSNSYHNKKDSLLLAARLNGQVVETVQLSLKTMEILQSRGPGNSTTQYHTQIAELVHNNIKEIKRRARAS